MILLMVFLAVGLVMTGPIVDAVAAPLGVSSTAVDLWNVAKWPVMALVFLLLIALLYYASPNVKRTIARWSIH